MRQFTAVTEVHLGDTIVLPGEPLELDKETAGPLLDVGAITLGGTDDPGIRAALDQAIEALRQAGPDEVVEFLRTITSDPEISEKIAPQVDRAERIFTAMAGLDPENPEHFTKSGKPEIKALEAATGLDDISAAERDARWEDYQEALAKGDGE